MRVYIKLIAVVVFIFILGVSVYAFENGGIEDHQTATNAYFDASLRAKPLSVSLSQLESNKCIPGRTYQVNGYITGADSLTPQSTLYTLSDNHSLAHTFSLISTKTYTMNEAVSLSAVCIAKYSLQTKTYMYTLFE